MFLRRLVAFPESRRILSYHLLATGLITVQHGVLVMVPVLIRKQFGGGEWATALAASALIIMNLLSIFWNEVYRRMNTRRYMLLMWLTAYVPLGAIAVCRTAGEVLTCVFISATGTAGINPLIGDILRSCYPPSVRSKVFGSIQSVTQFSIMATAWVVGLWLNVNDQAFRIYFPIAVLVLGAGMLLLSRIACQLLFVERSRHYAAEPFWVCMKSAYQGMWRVLRSDATFRRFELSYCTFNFAWLICVGLLPLLLADVLRLDYKQVALSSQVPLQLILFLGTVPSGILMDRVGPIRMSVWAFALIALYPFGLILAGSAWHVCGAIAILGISLTAVNLGWTIGPVTLAHNPAHASQYLAIHWTLTTLAGLLGQIPAVIYYHFTGDIRTPLAAAAAVFLLSCVLIWRLSNGLRLGPAVQQHGVAETIRPNVNAV